MIIVRVECYAGYKADERPLRFELGNAKKEVTEICDQWHSPGATYYRLKADDSNVYVLRHEIAQDIWILESFRPATASE